MYIFWGLNNNPPNCTISSLVDKQRYYSSLVSGQTKMFCFLYNSLKQTNQGMATLKRTLQYFTLYDLTVCLSWCHYFPKVSWANFMCHLDSSGKMDTLIKEFLFFGLYWAVLDAKINGNNLSARIFEWGNRTEHYLLILQNSLQKDITN